MIQIKDHTYEKTFFPDGTCQIWHIKPDIIPRKKYFITWYYEGDHEIFDLFQLAILFDAYETTTILYVPFLPYGRQDKEISNHTTFAKIPLMNILMGFDFIKTFDLHSCHNMDNRNIIPIKPDNFFNKILKNNYDLICFPDEGAANRYSDIFKTNNTITFCKKRDEQGKIISMSYITDANIDFKDKNVIIFDDICDGGTTFVKVAEILKERGVKNIDLCVSHGIFSKGINYLKNNGIRNIYTTNSRKGNELLSPYYIELEEDVWEI